MECQVQLLKDLRTTLAPKKVEVLDHFIAEAEKTLAFEAQCGSALAGFSKANMQGSSPQQLVNQISDTFNTLWGPESKAYSDYMSAVDNLQLQGPKLTAFLNDVKIKVDGKRINYSNWVAKTLDKPQYEEITNQAKEKGAANFNPKLLLLENSDLALRYAQRVTRIPMLIQAVTKEAGATTPQLESTLENNKTQNDILQVHLDHTMFNKWQNMAPKKFDKEVGKLSASELQTMLDSVHNRLPILKRLFSR